MQHRGRHDDRPGSRELGEIIGNKLIYLIKSRPLQAIGEKRWLRRMAQLRQNASLAARGHSKAVSFLLAVIHILLTTLPFVSRGTKATVHGGAFAWSGAAAGGWCCIVLRHAGAS